MLMLINVKNRYFVYIVSILSIIWQFDGQLRISGICFGKYGFFRGEHISTLSDWRRKEAPATSLYGDVTDAGSAIFGDDFDVESGAGEKWGGVGRSHDKTCRDNRRIN